MKTILAALLSTALLATALSACTSAPNASADSGSSTAPASSSAAEAEAEPAALGGNLIVMTNTGDATFDAVQKIIDGFAAENPGVKVDFSTQGKDYEQLMKAKMAANDLPDLFATHGWSVNRYSEYLIPLNDQPFAAQIVEPMLPVVSNSKGEIFVMPFNLDKSGITYNKTVLADIGMPVPKTWDEFLATCEAAKGKGYIPVYMTGKDDRNPANLLDIAAVTFLVSDEQASEAEALKDGSFDWSKWGQVAGFLRELKDKGYMNVDAVTADPITRQDKFAANEVLFQFQNNAMLSLTWEVDPEAQVGMMPVPTLREGDEPVLIGGEREAYGIWKGTGNKDAAYALINYMAKPENIQLVCEASSSPAALKGVAVDLGKLTEDFDATASLRIFPYFDREYLPSGMWAVLRTTGGALLAGEASVEEVNSIMQENYEKLRSQEAE